MTRNKDTQRDQQGRFSAGTTIGRRTRLGPDWPGKRCGAQSKRTGLSCQNPAVIGRNRCRLHGGLSTGPRTPEGRARLRRALTTHGLYVGPGHPDFDTPGPYWRDPERTEVRRSWRAALRRLQRELPEVWGRPQNQRKPEIVVISNPTRGSDAGDSSG